MVAETSAMSSNCSSSFELVVLVLASAKKCAHEDKYHELKVLVIAGTKGLLARTRTMSSKLCPREYNKKRV